MKNILFLLLFISFHLSFAQTTDMTVFLSQDFDLEVKTADFVTPALIQKHSSPVVYTNLKLNSKAQPQIQSLTGSDLKLQNGHSIHNLQLYVEQRLGKFVTAAAAKKQIDLKAYAGSEVSFFQHVEGSYPDMKSVTKLPSLYEEWGITKYLVQFTDSKSALYFHIPASYKYAQHYASMIRFVTGDSKVAAYFDKNSETEQRQSFKKAAQSIQKNLGSDYQFLSFGYSYVWKQILQNNKTWKLNRSRSSEDAATGLQAEMLEIENLKTQQISKVLLLSSKKTVWGELVPMMMSAFFNSKVKSAIFMGSAGSTSKDLNIYDLSVPRHFVDKKGLIDIKNIFAESKMLTSNVRINIGATHGNTYSPIEQNYNYLKSINKASIQTLDVEQSLLAREILNFNQSQKANIQFGAINVITDKPYQLLEETNHEFSLDYIDHSQKGKSRVAAVNFILNNLSSSPKRTALQCKGLF